MTGQGYTLETRITALSGIKQEADKIWAGVGSGDTVAASITILRDATANEGRIELNADNVIINGGLSAGVVTAAALAANAVTANAIAAEAITAGAIAAGSITAGAISAGSITAGAIAAGVLNTQNVNVVNNLGVTVGGFCSYNDVDGDPCLWLGSASSMNAPFSVDANGVVIASRFNTQYTEVNVRNYDSTVNRYPLLITEPNVCLY